MEEQKPIKWKDVEPGVWKPEKEEDFIEGILVNKKSAVNENESNQYFIENKDGIFLVWGSTIIDSRMKFIEVGSLVRITYKETTKNKKNQDLKIFKVQVGEIQEGE